MNHVDYLAAARRVEKSGGIEPWTALMRVLVAKLQGIELPSVLDSALQQAACHWSGNSIDLPRLKVEVWTYIRANWASGAELASAEGRLARALLCVLEPEGDEEAYSMRAEWFAEMVDSL